MDQVKLDNIVNEMRDLTEEELEYILSRFCRSCRVYVGEKTDWCGRNYCDVCSPDPRE